MIQKNSPPFLLASIPPPSSEELESWYEKLSHLTITSSFTDAADLHPQL